MIKKVVVTKEEAKQIIDDIIQYFLSLIEFERAEDIRYEIVDGIIYENDELSMVNTIPTHMVYDMTFNISAIKSKEELIKEVCHELAHVFLAEFTRSFYEIHGDCIEGMKFRSFSIANERATMRFARLLSIMYFDKLGNTTQSKELMMERLY